MRVTCSPLFFLSLSSHSLLLYSTERYQSIASIPQSNNLIKATMWSSSYYF